MTFVGLRRGTGRLAAQGGPTLLFAALASLIAARLWDSLHAPFAFFAILLVAAYPSRRSTLARLATVAIALVLAAVLTIPLRSELYYSALCAVFALPFVVGRATDPSASTLRLAVVTGAFAIIAVRAYLPGFHFGDHEPEGAIAAAAMADQTALLEFGGVATAAAVAGVFALRRVAAASLAFLACATSLVSACTVAALGYALARETPRIASDFGESATRFGEWADAVDWIGGAVTAACVVASLAVGLLRFRRAAQWSLVAVPLACLLVTTVALRVPSPILQEFELAGSDQDWRGVAGFAPLTGYSPGGGFLYGRHAGEDMLLLDRDGRAHAGSGADWAVLEASELRAWIHRTEGIVHVLADRRVTVDALLGLAEHGVRDLVLVLVSEDHFAAEAAGRRWPFVRATLRRADTWWICSAREGVEYVDLCRRLAAARGRDETACKGFSLDAVGDRAIASVREAAGAQVAFSSRLVDDETPFGAPDLDMPPAEPRPLFAPLLEPWLSGAACGALLGLAAFMVVVLCQLYARRRALERGRWRRAPGTRLPPSAQRLPSWAPLRQLELIGIRCSSPYRDRSVVWAGATATAGVALRTLATSAVRMVTAVVRRIAVLVLYGLAIASALGP